ncbi:MAG: phage major capsid protein [Magnetococcales bacterium]|nr:phage major capsid protein [Magnetococcales bacterium]MBF0438313.1 phage major capsid protein [Magnetococcales bacterium]
MSKELRELQGKKADALVEARKITTIAASEGRDLTEEETKGYDAISVKIKTLSAAIDREIDMISAEAQGAAVAKVVGHETPAATNTFGSGEKQNDPKGGFQSFGVFAAAVRVAGQAGGAFDRRLAPEASMGSTYSSGGVGADGGFLIPPEFSTELFRLSLDGDALLPLTRNADINSNVMSYPYSEATPWGATGVKAYWEGEGDEMTKTKLSAKRLDMRLHRLGALVPVTQELLDDTQALSSYLIEEMSSAIRWKVNDAILSGTGAGMPTGCLASSAAMTVPKESAQPTMTLVLNNVTRMIATLPPGSKRTAIWILNNDVLPYLHTISTPSNAPPAFVQTAATGALIPNAPDGLLLGMPVIASQHANTFSSVGDVNLIDLKYYRTTTKSGGISTATSMHLYFDQNAVAFRATFRMDGKSIISAPIVPNKGSNNMSPFVLLGAR